MVRESATNLSIVKMDVSGLLHGEGRISAATPRNQHDEQSSRRWKQNSNAKSSVELTIPNTTTINLHRSGMQVFNRHEAGLRCPLESHESMAFVPYSCTRNHTHTSADREGVCIWHHPQHACGAGTTSAAGRSATMSK